MTDVDFLICDTTGSVLLTTDADLAGKTVVVPEDITQTVLGSERLYEAAAPWAYMRKSSSWWACP